MKTDKRTSNLFIAGGYCLVAIIILFNYLGQASVTRDRTVAGQLPADGAAGQAVVLPGNMDALTRQLDEEKRVNLEMREMLKMMQTAMGEKKSGAELLAGYALPETPGSLEIPEIRFDLAEDMTRVRANPFIPGKNPFAPTSKNEDSGRATIIDVTMIKALRCDPRLPFFISGANSKSGYFANF